MPLMYVTHYRALGTWGVPGGGPVALGVDIGGIACILFNRVNGDKPMI